MVSSIDIVPIIVTFIIILQFIFFFMNVRRMYVYRNIFSISSSWRVLKDPNTGFVQGITGVGNIVFNSIRESINKYLGNNKGSVIDFHLLKDAVDRHCDSVEEDISTQTPVPLYCGLAGTMIGVIIGLGSLLQTGSIDALIGGSGTGNVTPQEANALMEAASMGINELLRGVAWAMAASICGIALTTINSLMFKGCKLNEEKGKNDFLAWMQAVLLPELPNDTSDALTKLVKNLNRFNDTFYHNTQELGVALKDVNKSYAYQADIIKNVHDMDVMKMAQANVNVLKELQQCTDKLETFNDYLNRIKGYTETIQRFNDQFNKEADRLHVMEEIRDFFERNKAEIALSVTDEDEYLKNSLKTLQETSTKAVDQLSISLTEQSDKFRSLNDKMCREYSARLGEMPKLQTQLEAISEIPKHITSLAHRIESSNADLVDKICRTLKSLGRTETVNQVGTPVIGKSAMPKWMKFLISFCAIIITICVIGMTYFMVDKLYLSDSKEFQTPQNEQVGINEPETESSFQQIDYPNGDVAEVAPMGKADTEIFDVVDQMPHFNGGDVALMDYLNKNIKYPVIAEENGVQGRVVTTFVVECDGSITGVKVIKSVDPSLDKEAVRVVKAMPKWNPGKLNGSAVRVKFTLPVTFRLK